MPTKRRRSKRRAPDASEFDAWWCVWWAGSDFDGALERYGIRAQDMTREAFREAAEAAWRRHGAAFMADWRAEGSVGLPWAAREFGEGLEK